MQDEVTALQLRTGPYIATYTGAQIIRESTKEEWTTYGEILKRVDEAKQWIVGDWLADGKRHYGDGLYKEAERILGTPRRMLEQLKWMSQAFEITRRRVNLSWSHHLEVASIDTLERDEKGMLAHSENADWDKIVELLDEAHENHWSVRDLRDQVKRYKRQQDELIRLANEPEKYSVIYADPPWKYGDELIDGYGAASDHYPSMTIKELCALPVKDRAADNAVLFLWVTAPINLECREVIRAWGFEYKTQFVWDKVRHNYGHYNSVRHELLLICTRGRFMPETSELLDSVVTIERSDEHSEKPEAFRAMIETMYPNGNRLELFARSKHSGWVSWGDES